MPKNTSPSDRSQRPGNARPRRERHLSVRAELRKEPDLKKLARAVAALALAQAEADAQADKARLGQAEDAK